MAHSFPAHCGRWAPPTDRCTYLLIFCRTPRGRVLREKVRGVRIPVAGGAASVFVSDMFFATYRGCVRMLCGWRRPSAASRAYRGRGDASNARRKGWKFARYFPCRLAMARGEERLCEVQRRTLAVGSPRRREKNVFPQCISLPGDTTCRGGRERTPCKVVRQRRLRPVKILRLPRRPAGLLRQKRRSRHEPLRRRAFAQRAAQRRLAILPP